MSSIIKVDTIQDQDGNNIINENANTITIGKSGDTVTVALGATFVGGGIEWQSTIVTTSTLSAVAGKGYWIDTTSNACTVTLPASASAGDQIIFVDYARTWGTNNVTLNRNGLNYQGGTENPVYDTNGQTVNIVYSGATNGWIPISDDDVADEGTLPPYSAEYLVVAGGGGGGTGNAGGGGAGGLLTNYGVSTITLTPAEVYTVTVGAGASVTANPPEQNGANGSNSVLSGTGIATITAIGGGYGGSQASQGGSGGSGGGNGYNGTGSGGSGTVGQGNDGGSGAGVAPPAFGAGGGGGAGAVGGNGTGPAGGNGGDGLSNSITGSATFYAGGGGGGVNNNLPSAGSGGNGGGGAGSYNTGVTPGTANTGGGGGGGGAGGVGGAGGSGVVILRVPTANYSTTTTGSPTVTTDGTDTVIKFTGSGSYTA
jgi:hypothetical protein